MEKIRAIIFDWGGVLIEDPGPGLMRYCANSLNTVEEDYIKAHRRFAADFQRGEISEDKFWTAVCGELGAVRPANPSPWKEAFEAVYSPKAEMFALVRVLQKNGYKTALLSNTEPPAMRFFHQQGYEMFDVCVFSCAEGTVKPERKIYEMALKRLGVKPDEAVFTDDREDYIDGAKEAGLNTILFEGAEQVKKELLLLSVRTD